MFESIHIYLYVLWTALGFIALGTHHKQKNHRTNSYVGPGPKARPDGAWLGAWLALSNSTQMQHKSNKTVILNTLQRVAGAWLLTREGLVPAPQVGLAGSRAAGSAASIPPGVWT